MTTKCDTFKVQLRKARTFPTYKIQQRSSWLLWILNSELGHKKRISCSLCCMHYCRIKVCVREKLLQELSSNVPDANEVGIDGGVLRKVKSVVLGWKAGLSIREERGIVSAATVHWAAVAALVGNNSEVLASVIMTQVGVAGSLNAIVNLQVGRALCPSLPCSLFNASLVFCVT